ncbi:MAG: four helix bundle protein [Bacteroidales bacterium]|jgi:four helix bundle protein|nr:four helix bundle protein [Bacteroidales bacterium]
MRIDRFEDIQAWQKSRELCVEIYTLLNKARTDDSFEKQMKRAVVSVMNNIAEGFERKSNNEMRYFFFVAKGSCGEVRSMLYLAEYLHILEKAVAEELRNKAEHISRMLSNFIKTL